MNIRTTSPVDGGGDGTELRAVSALIAATSSKLLNRGQLIWDVEAIE